MKNITPQPPYKKSSPPHWLIMLVFFYFFLSYTIEKVAKHIFEALMSIFGITWERLIEMMTVSQDFFNHEKIYFLSSFSVMVGTLITLFIVIKYVLKKSPKQYLGVQKVSKFSLLVAFFMFMVAFWSEQVIIKLCNKIIPSVPHTQGAFFSKFRPLSLLTIISTAVLIPIQEELLYRGFLLKSVEKNPFGKWGAIIISAFLFGLAHANWGGYNIVLTCYISGLFLGWMRYQGSIGLPILMHCAFNFISLVNAHLHA